MSAAPPRLRRGACPNYVPRYGPHRTRLNPTTKGGENLAISLSLVLVLGVAVWVLQRYAGLKLWHATVCILFGFCLAATTAAPTIRHLIRTIVAISGHH